MGLLPSMREGRNDVTQNRAHPSQQTHFEFLSTQSYMHIFTLDPISPFQSPAGGPAVILFGWGFFRNGISSPSFLRGFLAIDCIPSSFPSLFPVKWLQFFEFPRDFRVVGFPLLFLLRFPGEFSSVHRHSPVVSGWLTAFHRRFPRCFRWNGFNSSSFPRGFRVVGCPSLSPPVVSNIIIELQYSSPVPGFQLSRGFLQAAPLRVQLHEGQPWITARRLCHRTRRECSRPCFLLRSRRRRRGRRRWRCNAGSSTGASCVGRRRGRGGHWACDLTWTSRPSRSEKFAFASCVGRLGRARPCLEVQQITLANFALAGFDAVKCDFGSALPSAFLEVGIHFLKSSMISYLRVSDII